VDSFKTRLSVKVVAGASRTEIAGWQGETLRIRVAAPAERGKGNAAVVSLLCRTLGLPKDAVSIISGTSSPRKVVEIALPSNEINRRINNAGQRP
jgi:hypothetical protein